VATGSLGMVKESTVGRRKGGVIKGTLIDIIVEGIKIRKYFTQEDQKRKIEAAVRN